MSEHKHEGHDHHDTLAEEQPRVIHGSNADPVFPTSSEYQLDEGGSLDASTSKHPGMIWVIVAAAAVLISCIIFAMVGDWFTPQEAQQVNDELVNSQIVPEDESSNE